VKKIKKKSGAKVYSLAPMNIKKRKKKKGCLFVDVLNLVFIVLIFFIMTNSNPI